jgi:hypothetical protein
MMVILKFKIKRVHRPVVFLFLSNLVNQEAVHHHHHQVNHNRLCLEIQSKVQLHQDMNLQEIQMVNLLIMKLRKHLKHLILIIIIL